MNIVYSSTFNSSTSCFFDSFKNCDTYEIFVTVIRNFTLLTVTAFLIAAFNLGGGGGEFSSPPWTTFRLLSVLLTFWVNSLEEWLNKLMMSSLLTQGFYKGKSSCRNTLERENRMKIYFQLYNIYCDYLGIGYLMYGTAGPTTSPCLSLIESGLLQWEAESVHAPL
jgi:hypothetical protein